jgi:hypothetical protein
MFRSSTIIRKLVLCLAKVMLEHSVNYVLIVVCVLCAVQNETELYWLYTVCYDISTILSSFCSSLPPFIAAL